MCPRAVPSRPDAPVNFTSRPLPSGDCGFISPPSPMTAVPKCQCRSFWPNPQRPVFCACGHHACFHALEPTNNNSAPGGSVPGMMHPPQMQQFNGVGYQMPMVMPQPVIAGAAMYPPVMQMHPQAAAGMVMGMGFGPPPPGFVPMQQMHGGQAQVQAVAVMPACVHAQLRALEDKVDTLMEFMEEAEERLTGMEIFGVELEDNLDELEKRADLLEETVEGIGEGPVNILPPIGSLVKTEYDGENEERIVEEVGDSEDLERQGEQESEGTVEDSDSEYSTAQHRDGFERRKVTKRRLSLAESESERPVSASPSPSLQSKRMRMSHLTDRGWANSSRS